MAFKKYNLVILANELKSDHQLWIEACEKFRDRIDYRIVDLTSSDWLTRILSQPFDYILTKPGGFNSHFKQLYDERLHILVIELGFNCYPSLKEVLIYENKRYLSFFLQANNIPHPYTVVFYNKNEAINFCHTSNYPLVAKLNIGASGHGVSILANKNEAEKYIHRIFTKGISSKTGPRFKKGNLVIRVYQKFLNFNELVERIRMYKSIINNPQKNFCLFQEFIEHSYEWRVVRIGNSFYAHKKIVSNGKASGALKKVYLNPPLSLLDFTKEITDKYNFFSMALDIFEKNDGTYLVNEMQCIFGQSDPYQMQVDDQPGRYINVKGQWIFEKGMFNTNECFDERIAFLISVLDR